MEIKHTYSIVAVSEDQTEIGVAVQSHWFAVGAVCPWIKPGIGAIATQSMVEVSYGPKGLKLLGQGESVQQVLDQLLAQDAEKALRQVAILSADGKTATHTGKRCIAEAGHKTGANYSVQANMMIKNTVWPAMAKAFESARGLLARRLFAALEAAQNEGGDIRGMQSAAILVADNILDDRPWEHLTTNVRVDDHPSPLEEIKRLLDIEGAYACMHEGETLLAKGEVQKAKKQYAAALTLAPQIDELSFWEAVSLADVGEVDLALPIFKKVFKAEPNWAVLVQRLPASGLLTEDPEVMEKILSVLSERKT